MNYRDFYADFGERCFDIQEAIPTTGTDRSVTMALAIMATALTIPHERLMPVDPQNAPREKRSYHPSGDGLLPSLASQKYAEMLAAKFSGWLANSGGAGWEEDALILLGQRQIHGHRIFLNRKQSRKLRRWGMS